MIECYWAPESEIQTELTVSTLATRIYVRQGSGPFIILLPVSPKKPVTCSTGCYGTVVILIIDNYYTTNV